MTQRRGRRRPVAMTQRRGRRRRLGGLSQITIRGVAVRPARRRRRVVLLIRASQIVGRRRGGRRGLRRSSQIVGRRRGGGRRPRVVRALLRRQFVERREQPLGPRRGVGARRGQRSL